MEISLWRLLSVRINLNPVYDCTNGNNRFCMFYLVIKCFGIFGGEVVV